jgi:hypothetical protein
MEDALFVWGAVAIVMAFCVGVAATSRGRSFWAWLLLSVVLSPIVALILLILLPKTEIRGADTHKQCPECKETILKDARKCRYCGSQLACDGIN